MVRTKSITKTSSKYLLLAFIWATSGVVQAAEPGAAATGAISTQNAADAAAMAASGIGDAVTKGQAALRTPEGQQFLADAKGARHAIWTAAKLSADEMRLTDMEAAQIVKTENGETQVIFKDGSAIVGYISSYYLLKKVFAGKGLIAWAVKITGGITLAYLFYHESGNFISMSAPEAEKLEQHLSAKIQAYKAELAATQAGQLVTGY